MLPPAPSNPDAIINGVIRANGYARGAATIDFKVDPEASNEAYIMGLLNFYEKKGFSVDGRLSKLHNFSGVANGKLIAVFHKR
jgi:hypothetical protein